VLHQRNPLHASRHLLFPIIPFTINMAILAGVHPVK
jgi:hypothetical protein